MIIVMSGGRKVSAFLFMGVMGIMGWMGGLIIDN